MKLAAILSERFVLMVSLPKNDPELARAAVEAGADCLKVHLNCHHFASDTRFGSWSQEREALAEIRNAIGGVPLGLVSGEEVQPSDEDWSEIRQFGFDFWDLFCRFTLPEYLGFDDLGKMVAIDSAWTPDLVRSLASFGVDVIESSIVPRTQYRGGLTLEDLAAYHKLAQCSPIPILIPTQRAVRPQQVGWLRRAGAAGVTIGAVVTGLEVDSLREVTSSFRASIDSLS